MEEQKNGVLTNDNRDDEKFELYDWVQCIVEVLIIGVLCFMFLFRVIGVDGSSMVPTLRDKDQLVVSRLFYTPKQGDIVVFQTDAFGDSALVKRIIATEGQSVDIDFSEGVVYVDDVPLDEPYTAELTYTRENFDGRVTVPEGCLFVMGDNRNASTDSRSTRVGMVDTRSVIGKVYLIAFPGSDETTKWDLRRIGGVY
ncbi:MAG: signal peptidase I [Oscillospiraceae bacterium]|nr:signal peptidase I [Oscillospiraceae bacterium]